MKNLKRLISTVVSTTMIFSMVAAFSTVAKAESQSAYVKLIEQTDTSITLEIGATQDGNLAYISSYEFRINIPESILDTSVAAFADKATTNKMFYKANPSPAAPTAFNTNLITTLYENYGTPTVQANYADGKFQYAASIPDGAGIPANGGMIKVTLPLIAPVAADTEITLNHMVIQESADFATWKNYIKDTADGEYAGKGVIDVALADDTNCVLKGAAVADPVLTATANDVESIVAPSGNTTYAVSGNVTVENGATFNKVTLFINDETDADNVLSAKKEWTFDTAISANAFFGLNIWGAPAKRTITVDIVAE